MSSAEAAGAKRLRRLNTSGQPDDMPLPGRRYGFGLSWDAVARKPNVDLDLQCVCVDAKGKIIDCVYYNNMKALRAITHSGDETTGAKDGIDELIWATLPALPETVALLVFVVAAYAGGVLSDVTNGTLHLFEEKASNEIGCFQLEQSDGAVDIVGVVFRTDPGWSVRMIDEPAKQGQHFMDILPELCAVIRTFIPDAPRRQKVAFAVEKDSVMDFAQNLDIITVGLGWDIPETNEGDEIDVDVSAILIDSAYVEVETVFFGRLESEEHGIKHTGDNVTGEGDGDDEQIVVSLNSIGPRVQHVVFVINIYTQDKTFANVRNPYCRIVDCSSGDEVCKYLLNDAGSENGMIISKLAREVGGRWSFHALGLPCPGRTYKDSLQHVQHVCQHGGLAAGMSPVATQARWTCSICDEVNRPERTSCNNCSNAR